MGHAVPAGGLHGQGDEVDAEQDRQVRGDDLDEVVEIDVADHRQGRGMDAVLQRTLAPGALDEAVLDILVLAAVGAQAVDHEGLQVDHVVAQVALRRRHAVG